MDLTVRPAATHHHETRIGEMLGNLFGDFNSGNSFDAIIVEVLVGAVVADHLQVPAGCQFVYVDHGDLGHRRQVQ